MDSFHSVALRWRAAGAALCFALTSICHAQNAAPLARSIVRAPLATTNGLDTARSGPNRTLLPAAPERLQLSLNDALMRAVSSSSFRQKELLDVQQAEIDLARSARIYRPNVAYQAGYLSNTQTASGLPGSRSSNFNQSLAAEVRSPLGGGLKTTLSSGKQTQADGTATQSQNIALELSQPLLRGAWAAGRIDEKLGDKANEQRVLALQKGRNSQLLFVAGAFYNLYLSQQQVQISKTNVERNVESERINEELYKVGRVSRLSLATGAANSSRAKLQLQEATTQLEESERSFLRLLGYDNQIALQILLPAGGKPLDVPPLPRLLQSALENRIEIKSAELDVQAAQLSRDRAQNDRLPRVDLSVRFENGKSAAADVRSPTSRSVGLTLEVPLTRSEINAASSTAQIALERAQIALNEARLAIEAEVRQLHAKGLALLASRDLVTSYVSNQRMQLNADLERFRSGRASATELRTSQDALKEAELAVLNLEIDQLKLQFDLIFATGTERSALPDFVYR